MKNWKKYLITLALGLCIAFAIAIFRGVFKQTTSKGVFIVLSEAFSIPGLIMLFGGALIICISAGALRGVGYAFHLLFATHSTSRTKFEERKTYMQYVEEKKANAKPAPKYILYVGLTLTVIALIFTGIYRIA